MKIGILVPWFGRRSLQLAREIEGLGFDSLWTGEHIVGYVSEPEGLAMLAALVSATRKLTVGTSVLSLPLRHPVMTAKSLATIDVLAEGRIVVGVGAGGDFKHEFEACQVPLANRGARLNEAVEAMKRLWSGIPATFTGRNYTFHDVKLDIAPHSKGGPPIWVGGRAEEAIKRAAHLGDGFIPYMYDAKKYSSARDRIIELREEIGRPAGAFTFALCVHTFVSSNVESAEAAAASVLAKRYRIPPGPYVRRYGVLGTIDDCTSQLAGFAAAGVEHVVLDFAGESLQEFHDCIGAYADCLDVLHELKASNRSASRKAQPRCS